MALKTDSNLIFNKLSSILTDRAVVVGIGNTLRSDDGFGSYLASNLKDKINLKVWDVGITIENFLGVIVKDKPNSILLIDAVDFGGTAGELRLFSPKEIKIGNFFFTHNLSLSLLLDFFQNIIKAKPYLLAIQPKTISFGLQLSPEVETRLEELRLWFLDGYGIQKI